MLTQVLSQSVPDSLQVVPVDTSIMAVPQPPPVEQALPDTTGVLGGGFGPETVWELVSYAQGFEWPLGIIFVVGLFLLCSAYVRYFLQWSGSKTFLQIDIDGITPSGFDAAISEAGPRSPYRLAGQRLLEDHGRGGNAESMVEYATRFIDFDHANYKEIDRYITAAVYIALSLGLLGTLMGIFVLFMSGSRHEASDLVGLGIAVVSTMLALVVRLTLWPVNIILQANVRNKYRTLKKWTVAFGYALAARGSG